MAATYPPGNPRSGNGHGNDRGSRHTVRREPGKVPAAILALIVHTGFFAVIVFGVSWQVNHPTPAVAELWDQLPPMRNAPEPTPPPPQPEPEPEPKPEPKPEVKKVEPPPEVKPAGPSKAEIELKAKKLKEEKEREKAEKEKLEREKLEKQKKADAEKKKREEEAQKKAAKAADDRVKAEQAAREAAASAARNAALQDYAGKIAALIRSRANIPDTVSGKPVLQVRLRLLVNGVVFDAQIVKPSGNRVYDEAVERAINGIKQWPLPESAELFGGRRELNLNIEHER
ncbi:MAG: TonB C-terminal domain-containing protein [Betaproteobacteria bacterium]|nr:TonB C-terminal domain-containing protein [Betaproteobacteria bacterium]